MKNLLVFYIAILIPIPLLIWAASTKNSTLFFVSLALYIIYRGVTDGVRLFSKDLIKKSEIWKFFIPFWFRVKYFKELYLKK